MPDMTFNPDEVSAYYTVRVPQLKQSPTKEWRGPCPIHNGKGDNFTVDPKTGLWFCHSECGFGGGILRLELALTNEDFSTCKSTAFQLMGVTESENWPEIANVNSLGADSLEPTSTAATAEGWKEVERYAYQYFDESLQYEVIRYLKPDGQKSFRQCRPGPHGGVIWDLKDIVRIPYRLPKVIEAETVYLPEGEKDVHTLEEWDLVASCNPGGSSGSHVYVRCAQYFDGRHIVILPDNDEPGRKHALDVAAALLTVAASIRIVELPGLPPKGDVTDWRNAGGTFEEFCKLTEAAAPLDDATLSELRARWGLVNERPHHQARAGVVGGWPKPEPIQSELPPVQAFYENLLPDSFRPLVADVTERMQVPMDYPAAVMVLCLAGAVNRRAVIQPKAQDTGWVVVPNLWGGIIAPPGYLKSPVIQAATNPLHQIQAEWRQEHEDGLQDYLREKEENDLRRAAWKEQFKASAKKGTGAPSRPEDEAEAPKLRRLIVNDATFEALHQTMSANSAGILVIRDELTGWWSTLDKPGREGERAFALEAWAGDSAFTVDRIGRGTIHVPHCCMSMLGGIQPGRLRSYLVDALKDGPSNDGLIQRFQLLVWPDTSPDWNYVDRAPDAALDQQAACVFRKVLELDSESPARFRFDVEAQELFVNWLAELEAKVRGDELHPALVSHLAKYRSLMPSLALLFEVADRAGSVGFEGSLLANSPNFVTLEQAKRAAAWCEYLEFHARRVYSCIATPQLRGARELAEKIKHRKLGTDRFFSCRDVYLKGWSALDSPEAVKQAAEVLHDAGWVRDLSTESGPFGGRPSNRYEVNPAVWG